MMTESKAPESSVSDANSKTASETAPEIGVELTSGKNEEVQKTQKTHGQVIRGRHLARVRAVQALYQWDLNPIETTQLVKEFYSGAHDMKKVDADYFQAIVKTCTEQTDELDACFTPHLQIDLSLLDPVERCVLRLSTYELKHRIDVPKRVVINEGVEMAKLYGAADGHKFINGVLDKVAKKLREFES